MADGSATIAPVADGQEAMTAFAASLGYASRDVVTIAYRPGACALSHAWLYAPISFDIVERLCRDLSVLPGQLEFARDPDARTSRAWVLIGGQRQARVAGLVRPRDACPADPAQRAAVCLEFLVTAAACLAQRGWRPVSLAH